jgi:glycoprotein endo-alpha-1,2-mannosidase
MRSLQRWATVTLLLGGLLTAGPPVSAAPGATPRATVASTVHIFYYPWYGSPAVAGSYRHWPQGGHTPPNDIGSNYFPVRGAYDSGDTAVLDQHMAWLNQAGVGVAVTSWWGQGSYEDSLAPAILAAADRHGIKVAWHIEPYGGRTAASVVSDVNYLNSRYGGSPAFYRDTAHGNRSAFYVFDSLDITDWTALDQVRSTAIVLAQTTDTSKVAHFGGMYTYDGIAGATAPGWANASAFCKANGLVWSPSIAPGYIDDRAVPGNTTPTLSRDNGAAYDREWSNALGAATGGPPTWISITSFNEWHEGSQIEPASSTPPAGFGYLTYSGAYGTSGAAGETSYVDRTRFWVNQFVPVTPPGTGTVSLRAHANGRFVTAGGSPLIAGATAIGTAEQFDQVDLGGGSIALRARANGMLVAAENAGTAALIANRTAVGQWETFALLRNPDGSISLRAAANGQLVTAENAGAAPLIANRAAVGSWEEFDLIVN